MKVLDILHETNESLLANKGRSALTILGIAIGITSVVVMASLITGFENWLEDSMGLGSARVITVSSEDSNYSLDEDDANFITEKISNVETALPQASTSKTVGTASASSSGGSSASDSSSTTSASSSGSSGGSGAASTSTASGSSGSTGSSNSANSSSSSTNASSSSSAASSDSTTLQLTGVSSKYFDIQNITLLYGSAYQDTKDNQVVLSESAVESIYGDSSYNPVGQSLKIGDESYIVVGVTESSQSMQSASGFAFGYVSYINMCEVLLGKTQIDSIYALAKENADVSYIASQIAGALAARHNVSYDDDGQQSVYTTSTTESALASLDNFTTAFDALAALIAGIALTVGGIGIMNMMLTNVTQRYREIGLRKSIGARPADIKIQFLSESIALCLIGGIFGTLAGWCGGKIIAKIIQNAESNFAGLEATVSPELIIIVFAICALIGIIFGYYPAAKAAKLNPAKTLRYQ